MTRKLSEKQIDLLLAQVQTVWRHFQEIRGEARAMLDQGQMPEAELQLKDVLKTTEEATFNILEQAGAIGAVLQKAGVAQDVQDDVQARIASIYEACSFQDLTGQRIKKVLTQIGWIGLHLSRLADIAQFNGDKAAPASRDPLLNGPQLSEVAPSQSEIDSMFSKV